MRGKVGEDAQVVRSVMGDGWVYGMRNVERTEDSLDQPRFPSAKEAPLR